MPVRTDGSRTDKGAVLCDITQLCKHWRRGSVPCLQQLSVRLVPAVEDVSAAADGVFAPVTSVRAEPKPNIRLGMRVLL